MKIPEFVPMPSPEVMHTMSIILLIVGACFVLGGFVLKIWLGKNEKPVTGGWVLMGIGVLLIANHGIQLLLK